MGVLTDGKRWESGATRPTRERLEVFGRALDLSPTEIEGLVLLAGLNSDAIAGQTVEAQAPMDPTSAEEAASTDSTEHDIPGKVAAASDADDSSSCAGYAMRYACSRFLMPGSCVALAGYFLASLGWNSSFMLLLLGR